MPAEKTPMIALGKLNSFFESSKNSKRSSRPEADRESVPSLRFPSKETDAAASDEDFPKPHCSISPLESLEGLLNEYVQLHPQLGRDAAVAESFIEWLQQRVTPGTDLDDLSRSLSHVSGVELTALQRQLDSARFRKLADFTTTDPVSFHPARKAVVFLTPEYVWASFDSQSVVGDRRQASAPHAVIVYQDGKVTRKATLNADQRSIVQRLEQGEMPLRSVFGSFRHLKTEEISLLLKQLAELRIIAIA